jgi:hypothetical protein
MRQARCDRVIDLRRGPLGRANQGAKREDARLALEFERRAPRPRKQPGGRESRNLLCRRRRALRRFGANDCGRCPGRPAIVRGDCLRHPIEPTRAPLTAPLGRANQGRERRKVPDLPLNPSAGARRRGKLQPGGDGSRTCSAAGRRWSPRRQVAARRARSRNLFGSRPRGAPRRFGANDCGRCPGRQAIIRGDCLRHRAEADRLAAQVFRCACRS